MPGEGLPYPEDIPERVGRNEQLSELEAWLADRGQPVAAVVGQSGVGKTSLASVFSEMQRARLDYHVYHLAIWEPDEALADAICSKLHSQKMASLVVCDLNVVPPADLDAQIALVLRRRPNTKLLLTLRHAGPIKSDTWRVIHLSPSVRDETFRLMGRHFELNSWIEWAEALSPKTAPEVTDSAVVVPGLVGADGRTLRAGEREHRAIVETVRTVSEKSLEELARRPDLLHAVSPRRFEEIVAELLTRQGYQVTLTPISRDGGKDIYVATRGGLGVSSISWNARSIPLTRPWA